MTLLIRILLFNKEPPNLLFKLYKGIFAGIILGAVRATSKLSDKPKFNDREIILNKPCEGSPLLIKNTISLNN